jgi:hypothetical protein
MDVVIEIICNEELTFESEADYEDLLTYCDWFFYDGNIDELDSDLCLTFRELVNNYIEPAYMLRLQSSHTDQ